MITSKALFLQFLNQEYIRYVDGHQPRQLAADFNETFTTQTQSVFLGKSISYDFHAYDLGADTLTVTTDASCAKITTISIEA